MFGLRKPVEISDSAGTKTELEQLREENEALRARVAALESRKAKQWDNLLGYDGRAQTDNLGGGDCE